MKVKKASAAYVFFATEHGAMLRKEKNFSVVDSMKASGSAWNALSEAEKEKYNKMAA
jgi:hypothetical protein